ncbi:probable receptor-like protein kinase [Tanacetum coccineum]
MGETEIKNDDAYNEEILDYEDGGEKAPYSAAVLKIKFSSLAYVNAIEFVSAPDMLIEDVSDALFPVWKKDGLGIQEYLKNKEAAKNLRVAPTVVKYLEGSSPLIAPQTVYASAIQIGSLNTIVLNFNITCQFDRDGSHPYLIRLHFCDIVSKSMNELHFNVYVGGKITINAVDLSMVTSGLSVAYYKEVFVDVSMNGLEILRVNNLVNSLDGEFRAAERSARMSRRTVAAV